MRRIWHGRGRAWGRSILFAALSGVRRRLVPGGLGGSGGGEAHVGPNLLVGAAARRVIQARRATRDALDGIAPRTPGSHRLGDALLVDRRDRRRGGGHGGRRGWR